MITITFRTKFAQAILGDTDYAVSRIFLFISNVSHPIVETLTIVGFRCGYEGDDFIKALYSVHITCAIGEGVEEIDEKTIRKSLLQMTAPEMN